MNAINRKIDQRTVVLLLLFIGALLWFWFAFGNSTGQANLFIVAKNTKTALALTANSLLGPFPTQTAPTKTPSSTPTATPLISATPTFTASVTITPSPTITPVTTATQRTRDPNLATNTAAVTPTPPVIRPTATRFVPTITSVPPTSVPPTSVPPTSVPPTDPPPTDIPPLIPLPTIPILQTLFP